MKNENNNTICMISSTHRLLDDRIYKKEAVILSQNGYKVVHIGYADCFKDYYTEDNIRIIQIKKTKIGQLTLNDLFRAAKSVSAHVYHLHDVELCRIALRLKKLSFRPQIIYDAHEPYIDNLKDYWQERSLMKVIFNDIPSLFAEKRTLKKVDYLIATEENVASRFRKENPNTSIIYNYSFFSPENISGENDTKVFDVIYCGAVSESKGIFLMINAIVEAKKKGYNFKIVIVGNFSNPLLKEKIEAIIQKEKLKDNVLFTGELPLEDVAQYYRKSKAAFCLFPLNRTNQLILPIKLFEYAAFGLPIIGSDFGHIKEIIQSDNIGIAVDPHNAEQAADALIALVVDGQYKDYIPTCIDCVKSKYLWETQKENLLRIYEKLLSPNNPTSV